MSAINDGGPAFPIQAEHIQRVADVQDITSAQVTRNLGYHPGISKREWFAGMAMQGILSNQRSGDQCIAICGHPITSKAAIEIADSMLYALAKKANYQ